MKATERWSTSKVAVEWQIHVFYAGGGEPSTEVKCKMMNDCVDSINLIHKQMRKKIRIEANESIGENGIFEKSV